MNEKKRARAEARAEKRAARAAAFEKTCAALKEAGYAMRDKTISVRRANWLGFLCGLPFAAVFFGSMWFLPYRQYALTGVFLADVPLFFVLLAVSIPVHECLHALFWAAANRSFAGISFGISNATPYCACGRPMRRGGYILGTLAPFALLGVLPCVLALCFCNMFAAAVGACGILCAGGDILVAGRAIFSRARLLCDHPERCGFYAFYAQNGAK
ncbi:MAG TPA: DUF3267 domain-containing protein [Candidatus Borkfalkia avistercoris]|uniref:DUF3267 domain-containing protein n=1 Tax=Candidatus Borkfalkia avistercoris TaxID=2838504 RepID=A0A9D2IDR5_9FIRM|nr:DUF3267 domain-containing protein [Candidatus Borkfalkia avistercoris]